MPARWTLSLVMLLTLSAGAAQASPDDDPWKPFHFLAGQWEGEGSGEPGKNAAGFSFAWELDKKILVRKHRSDFPAAQGRPATSHEDLTVIYPGQDGKATKAIYFDNEGHVINYTVTFSEDQQTLIFLSDPSPSGPRFRLSYTKAEEETLQIKFEIAPPGKPEAFKTYLDGKAHRPKKSKG